MRKQCWVALIFFMLFSLPVFAGNGQLDPGGGYNLIYFLLICLFVIFIAYCATRWIGRCAKGLGGGNGRLIKIADTVYLGPNRGLHLVLVGKKLYLVGQADLGMNLLAELDDEELLAQAAANAAGRNDTAVMNGFGRYLQMFLARDAGRPIVSLGAADQLRERVARLRRRRERGE